MTLMMAPAREQAQKALCAAAACGKPSGLDMVVIINISQAQKLLGRAELHTNPEALTHHFTSQGLTHCICLARA